jgi:hypothetical protein
MSGVLVPFHLYVIQELKENNSVRGLDLEFYDYYLSSDCSLYSNDFGLSVNFLISSAICSWIYHTKLESY